MTTVFLDAAFKPFFLNRPWRGPTTDDRSDEFPAGWLHSNHSTYGICERKDAISNTPKRKNHTLKDRENEGGHDTSFNKRVVHKHVVLNRPSLHCYWSGQHRRKECRPPRPPPRHTYWVLPIQKMSGSRGSLCIKVCCVQIFPLLLRFVRAEKIRVCCSNHAFNGNKRKVAYFL